MIETVGSTAGLLAALKVARAGDTILLAAGAYNAVTLNNFHFSSAVTIASADPSHAAVLSDLTISNATGLTFKGLGLTTSTGVAASVLSSNQITFTNDMFSGSAAGSGSAMMVRNGSSGIAVTNSDFGKFAIGINELAVSNVSVTNNTFHDITNEAIRGTATGGQTISGNTFATASAGVANHADVVYLWQGSPTTQALSSSNTFGTAASVTTPPTTTTPTNTQTSTSTSTATSTATAPATPAQTSSTQTTSIQTAPTQTMSSTSTTATTSTGHSVTVNSTAGLMNALKSAHAGDTILLAAGTYDSAAISNLHFTTAVTIASADTAHAAVLSNLTLSNDSGLTFSHVNLSTTTGVAAIVGGSQQITFSNDVFTGSAAGSGSAMMIRSSDGVTVTGSDFGKFGVAINELAASNISITNNKFHDLSNEAVRGTIAGNETITGNTFANGNVAVANHSDMVYVWGTTAANQLSVGANTYGTTVSSGTTTTSSTSQTQSVGSSTSSSGGSTTGSSSSGPQTVTVTNGGELVAALKTAHAGDTIKMAAGSWTNLALNNYHFDGGAGVTITSASSTTQTVINGLTVNGSSGLNFTHLDLTQYNGSGPYIANAANINLANDTIEGAAGSLNGNGVMIRTSSGVSVANSVFQNLGSGMALLDNSGVTISNNKFTNINTDGIIGASSNVVVSGNTFSDFHPSAGAHPDAIQFFSDATGTSTNILIKDNVISRGAGDPVQGIFFENSSHVEITGNSMSGTMYNGISVSATNETIISNNYIQGYTDMLSWIITRGASADVSVVNNTTQANTNYAANGVNPNYMTSGTTLISAAAVGDDSAMHAWLSHHAVSTASLSDSFFLH